MGDENRPTCENSAHLDRHRFEPQCWKADAEYEVDIQRPEMGDYEIETLKLCESCYYYLVETVSAPDWEIQRYYL